MSPKTLTQSTNSQSISHSSPYQSNTPLTSRSPSTPNTIPSQKSNNEFLRTCDFSPACQIHKPFPPTPLEPNSLDTTPFLEGQIQCFGMILSSELPPSLQKVVSTHQIAQSSIFLSTGFDVDNTLESDGIVKLNLSLSLSLAKKTS